MKLSYYTGPVPNFGDELNPWLWQRLLPQGFLDQDPSELFIGIGSIISDEWPAGAMKHVIGSGYGGYTAAPDLHDGSWNVVFVRGPRTAQKLGLQPETAICDSAVLLRTTSLPAPAPGIDVAFMPHFHSLERGFWSEACRMAGIRMIDPRDDVEMVLAQIRGAQMLITEAMHGAIVADALRTPWVAVRPIHGANSDKWLDWAEALKIDLRVHPLLPTSLLEAWLVMTRTPKFHGPRAYRWNTSLPATPINAVLTRRAARHLARLAQQEPQLSDEAVIARVTDRAEAALADFVAQNHG